MSNALIDGPFSPRLEVLPSSQRRIWPELRDIPHTFTLYGGTAIAVQLGHRPSVDFAFFCPCTIDPDALLSSLALLRGGTVLQKEANSLTVLVDRAGPVQLSFFGVAGLRRLAPPLVALENDLRIAALIDLAGMKAAVVQKRAEAKDYLDLDALFTSGGLSLPLALAAGQAIYGGAFNPYITLKALCYFGDGNLKTVPLATQARLTSAVKSVDLDTLPKLDGL